MKKAFSILVLGSCVLWSGSQATAASFCDAVSGNLVLNCGFETGDFTSWTVGGNTLNSGGNYYGVDAFDANSGNYGAFMSQDLVDGGTAPVTLSQTLSTAAGSIYSVSFWLEQDTVPTAGYTHAFYATFGGTTLLNLTPTVAVPGIVGTFTEYTYSGTATGASTALTFSFENDDSYWSFDDASVTLTGTATPEPSTWILAGIALGVLFQMKRVSRA